MKQNTSFSPFTRSRKSKDVKTVGAEVYFINSVLVRIKCLYLNVDRLEYASIAMCENVKALPFFMFAWKGIDRNIYEITVFYG